jgi:carboxymethylenebutenolidase
MFLKYRTLFLKISIIAPVAFFVFVPILRGEDLPPGNKDAPERLAQSPRRTEVVEIQTPSGDLIKARVAYPEGSDPAPVVIALHGIPGWKPWIEMLADHLAAAGFIGVAPDMASGKGPGGAGTAGLEASDAARLVFSLTWEEVVERINAVADYAMALPGAQKQFAVMGVCWGGRTAFAYAGERPDLGAAIVYYGESPSADILARISAPILGLYGQDDARVNVTIEPAAAEMKRLGKSYQYEIYEGAGHAFLENQRRSDVWTEMGARSWANREEGANVAATEKAWPRTVQFLREHLMAR